MPVMIKINDLKICWNFTVFHFKYRTERGNIVFSL